MAAYQQGIINLVNGVDEYDVTFPYAFSDTPTLIDPTFYNLDTGDTTPLWIEGAVTARSPSGFTVTLTQPPDSGTYVMSWYAGDMNSTVTRPSLPGTSILGLPLHYGEVPDSSLVLMVIPGRTPKAKLTRLSVIKNSLSSQYRFLANQITDASVTGKLVLTGSASAGRAALNVPSLDQVDDAITMASDATAAGKGVLYADTVGDIRTFLNVPSSADVAPALVLAENITDLGTDIINSATAGEVRTLISAASSSHTHDPADIGAADAVHQHPAADITAASFVTGFLTASNVSTALSSINALPQHGWKYGYVSVTGNRTISASDLGSKLNITSDVTITLPGSTISNELSGVVSFFVSSGVTATFVAGAGVTLMAPNGQTLNSGFSVTGGYLTAERVGNSSWVLKDCISQEVSETLYNKSLSEMKSAMSIGGWDMNIAEFLRDFLDSPEPPQAQFFLGAAPSHLDIVNVAASSVEDLSDHYNATPKHTLFIFDGATSLSIDSVGSLEIGQSFEIHASSEDIALSSASSIKINDAITDLNYQNFTIPAGETVRFTLTDIASGNWYLVANIRYDRAQASCIWVSSTHGSNLTGLRGRPDLPFASLDFASAAVENSEDVIIVTPGNYSPTNNLQANGGTWYFMPGTTITKTTTSSLFTTTTNYPGVRVLGYGNFNTNGPLVSAVTASANVTFEADIINTPANTSNPVFISSATGGIRTDFDILVRTRLNRSNSALLEVVASTNQGRMKASLGTALVYLNEVAKSSGLVDVTTNGGDIFLRTAPMTGNGGGISKTIVRILNPIRVSNVSSGAPADTALASSNCSLIIKNCQRVDVIVMPGEGKVMIDSCNLYKGVVVDSSGLMVINSTICDGELTATTNAELNVAGTLSLVSSPGTRHVTRWNGSEWGEYAGGVNGDVYSVVEGITDTNKIFVGGKFITLAGQDPSIAEVANVAVWDTSLGVWEAMGTGMNGDVLSLAIDSADNVYAAGDFTLAGGVSVAGVAKWDGIEWSSIGYTGNAPSVVYVDPATDDLYVGGQLGDGYEGIQKYDGVSWTDLEFVDSGMTGEVRSIGKTSGGDLWVGGTFSNSGWAATRYLAEWDSTNLVVNADFEDINGSVNAITFDSLGNTYIAGDFTTIDSGAASRVAKLNGSTWSALGTGLSGTALTASVDVDDNLYVGGEFMTAGPRSTPRIAAWKSGSWEAVGNGVSDIVRSISTVNNIVVGGDFERTQPSDIPAGLTIVGGSVVVISDAFNSAF